MLNAVDRGMPRVEVARIFGISLPSVKRWLKRRRETGEVDPKPIPGPSAKKGALLEEWLPSQLRNNPDLTLQEHCEAFEEERGVKVSTATMSEPQDPEPSRRMAAQKKSKAASERDEGARGLWRWFLARFDVRRLVFVDESGLHIAMDRLRARGRPKGRGLIGSCQGTAAGTRPCWLR